LSLIIVGPIPCPKRILLSFQVPSFTTHLKVWGKRSRFKRVELLVSQTFDLSDILVSQTNWPFDQLIIETHFKKPLSVTYVRIWFIESAPGQCACGGPFGFRLREDGHEVRPHTIPFHVSLVVDHKKPVPFCSGSLLSPNYVLTTARCMAGRNQLYETAFFRTKFTYIRMKPTMVKFKYIILPLHGLECLKSKIFLTIHICRQINLYYHFLWVEIWVKFADENFIRKVFGRNWVL
jgi:hypothetical protein